MPGTTLKAQVQWLLVDRKHRVSGTTWQVRALCRRTSGSRVSIGSALVVQWLRIPGSMARNIMLAATVLGSLIMVRARALRKVAAPSMHLVVMSITLITAGLQRESRTPFTLRSQKLRRRGCDSARIAHKVRVKAYYQTDRS